MRKESTESAESRPEWEQLEDWVRSQVQRLNQELLEEEVTAFLGGSQRHRNNNQQQYRQGFRRVLHICFALAPVSASTVARLKSKWNDELAQWRSRPLDDLEVVYMWVDGVYVKAGLSFGPNPPKDGV